MTLFTWGWELVFIMKLPSDFIGRNPQQKFRTGWNNFAKVNQIRASLTVLSIPLTNSIIPTHITWATDQPVPPLSKLKKIF